jgi:hypothetical protein
VDPYLTLCHLKKPEGRFTTLSHCWGLNARFLALTASNFQEICDEIPIDTLLKAFREAFEIVK